MDEATFGATCEYLCVDGNEGTTVCLADAFLMAQRKKKNCIRL